MKNRERVITINITFTVVLNKELKSHLLYLFMLYPSFERSNENTYGNWITYQDLIATYNTIIEEECEKK